MIRRLALSLIACLSISCANAQRPQTPKEPFPYVTEEVSFTNEAEGATLSGTLTYPVMHHIYPQGSIPVVLMVTGSGAQDRNEELFGHKPFLVIADYLAKKGIASLRYDDRGVGKSTGPTDNTTSLNNKADALAGIEYLRSLGKFGKVGVLGHSEGGSIAFMMGAEGSVDFLVSLAGPATDGITMLVGQNRAILPLAGIKGQALNDYCTAFEQVLRDVVAGRIGEDHREHVKEIITSKNLDIPGVLEANLTEVIKQMNPWMVWTLAYNPEEDIKKISCPAMAINGSLDKQVVSKDNIPQLEKNLTGNDKNLIKEYPGLNHLFQPCDEKTAMSYQFIAETISEEVLEDIAQWITALK